MGADKNSLQRGTQPISQNHFQILKSLSCQIHVATEVLLDLGASIQPKAITTVAEQTTLVQRLAPVRPVKAGSPEAPHQVTRAPPETNRVTRTPMSGHPPNTCDYPQKTKAPVRPVTSTGQTAHGRKTPNAQSRAPEI